MKQGTIQLKDYEEENLIESLLNRMKIFFSKEKEDDDFVFTDEMKRVVNERLKEDHSTYIDANVVMEDLDNKYGL